MKALYIGFLIVISMSVYSCSDDSTSSSETKDYYSAVTVNDTTIINFEIAGLKINDTRTKDVNYASLGYITRIRLESLSSGSFTLNIYQDTIRRTSIMMNTVKDTTASFTGRVTKIVFVPTDFTGKGSIDVRGNW